MGRYHNDRKVSNKPCSTSWNNYCKRWIEVDTGLKYVEVLCRRVAADRTPLEGIIVERILNGETELRV